MPMSSNENHVRCEGRKCPRCGGESIESGPLEADAGVASAEVKCPDCKLQYTDEYALTGYSF